MDKGDGPDGLRIGLISDSVQLSNYAHSFAADLSRLVPDAEITALILQNVRRRRGLASVRETAEREGWAVVIRQASYSLLLKFERLVLRRAGLLAYHFGARDGRGLAKQVFEVSPIVSKSGFVYRYSPEDLDRIRALRLDVLVRLGSGILKGGILDAARHGVLSFHHADTRINRGGPAGFWEVYLKQESTGFILQRLTEELDAGDIVVRGHYPTKPFFLLNQASLYRKSNVHLARAVKYLKDHGHLPVIAEDAVYSERLYRLPTTGQQFAYLAAAIGRLLGRFWRHQLLRRRYRWRVAFLAGDWKRSVLRRAVTVPMEKGRFIADPFVVEEQGEHYLFVEEYREEEGKGCISAYRLQGTNAVPLGPALVESFHLSFPYVFRHHGDLFMCPETGASRQIRLYRCVGFPLHWELHRVVMDDVDAVDTMIVEHGGKWWMFTNIDSAGTGDFSSELHLFHSDDPIDGPWTPHPLNPVIIDSRCDRNAGILHDGPNLYRVGQRQGFGVYGKSSVIHHVTCLDAEHYAESALCEIRPNFFPGVRVTHHFHSNGKFTVFDYARLERMT